MKNISKIIFVFFLSVFLFSNSALAITTPSIPLALKSDPKNTPVVDLDIGDTITIVFSEPTNEPLKEIDNNNLSKSNVDDLFSFSTPIGNDYSGRWIDPLLFEITIDNPGIITANDLLVLVITAKASGGITNAALTSPASTSSPVYFLGNFDQHVGPTIIGLVADDPDSSNNDYSTGDTITVKFSESTNEPLKGLNNQLTKSDVDKLFLFGDGADIVTIGNDYSATWQNPSTLIITIDDATGASPIPSVGTLNATLFAKFNGIALKNFDETSDESDLFPFASLTGDFGGFAESIQVAAGGSVVTRLPSGILATLEPPPSVIDTITITRTTASTEVFSGTATFVGDVIDITSTSVNTCNDGCTFTFAISNDDLDAVGVDSSDLRVLHDRNHDEDFNDVGETLNTQILSGSLTETFLITATDDRISKFAIGGVANAAAGIGAAGNFLGLIQDHCDESGFGQGESLRIYEISYDKCDANQITILADTTCGPLKIFVGQESNMNLAGMPSEQPYLNEQKRMIVLSSPITSDITEFSVVAKDKRDEFYQKINADQCSATKQYTFTTGYTSEQNNAASLLLPDWIKNNAKWWSNDEIDDQTFVNGVQYLVEHDIISVQKDIQTENTNDTIPDWIKNNAKWWSNDEIDDQTFVNGIQHLVKVGIIKVN